jgi:hopene-associated glycosyltransferase HpnB
MPCLKGYARTIVDADAMKFPLRAPWMSVLATASLTGWVALALRRGRFWTVDLDAHRSEAGMPAPTARVEVVVPARDEARTIGAALASLLAQRYDGPLGITLVDDASTDRTAVVASATIAASPDGARARVIEGRDLQPPWTGKLNALEAGVHFARKMRGTPDFWLFTDADIEHHPDNVTELVAKAQRDNLDIVSLMVRLRCESHWEKLLVPAFIFFFRKLYPFAWSNDPARSTAAAAGGCVLIRAGTLEWIGGLQIIADRLIDDCALAAAVKSSGGSTWLGMSARTSSVRSYDGLAPFWQMVKRTAFTQLRCSYEITVLATAAMGFLYLVPPTVFVVALVRRDARLASVAGAGWTLMASLYLPTLRAYNRPAYEAYALPFAAALYMTMTLDSALAHARGRGGVWKGRTHGAGPNARADG